MGACSSRSSTAPADPGVGVATVATGEDSTSRVRRLRRRRGDFPRPRDRAALKGGCTGERFDDAESRFLFASHESDEGGSVVSLRWVVRGVGCALVLLALSAPAAQAGLISGVLPGLVSPSDTPSICDTASSQAFKSVDGDGSNY